MNVKTSLLRIIYILFSIFVSDMALAQDNSSQVVDIKESKDYIYAEGKGASLEEADQEALRLLVSKISVTVDTWFSNVEKEVTQNGDVTSTTAVESVMRSYSNIGSLPYVERIVEKEIYGDDYSFVQVCRYIEKSEVDRIFDARRNKVKSFMDLALKAEEQARIDVALQNYYWAYCLLKSLPHANDVLNENGDVLMAWIPAQMNSIFSEIRAEKIRKENNDVYIEVTYKGFPVKSLDFTYFDGRNRSRIASPVTDGKGIMYMFSGASTDKLRIYCEYEYKSEAEARDEEMFSVLNTIKGNPFPKSEIIVAGSFKTGKDKEEDDYFISLEEEAYFVKNEVSLSLLEEEEKTPYALVMDAVVKAIRTKNYDAASRYFTDRGLEMFQGLIKYGNAKVVTNPDFTYIRFGDEVICRSLMMSFAFRNNTRKFIENVNFTFNKDGMIEWLAFGLNEEDAQKILLNKLYTEQARVLLTQFLENYKTAFALKDLEYIKSIFDDNAVIITGTVIKPTKYTNKERKLYQNPIIKYNHYKKAQYMEKLERTFKSNEFVNIRFADHEIIKAGPNYGEVYGIQIKQDYYSSHYGDSGYLFLRVDFNQPDRPLIQVRTWQPEPDPEFGLYGLGNF